jgi:hypothetical protein
MSDEIKLLWLGIQKFKENHHVECLLSNCSFEEFEEFVRVHSLCHGDHMTCITEKRTKKHGKKS